MALVNTCFIRSTWPFRIGNVGGENWVILPLERDVVIVSGPGTLQFTNLPGSGCYQVTFRAHTIQRRSLLRVPINLIRHTENSGLTHIFVCFNHFPSQHSDTDVQYASHGRSQEGEKAFIVLQYVPTTSILENEGGMLGQRGFFVCQGRTKVL